jgi:REP element-mobilizing transposase RayT
VFDYRKYRRNLPHYQNAGKTYLVTFVTLRRWILPPLARDIAIEEVAGVHNDFAFVHVGIVMPDHVHIVMQPLWDNSGVTYALCTIVGRVKGRSARRINLAMGRRGRVWFDESHDHQIRNDESLVEKIEYVLQNPVRKGIVRTPDEYRWIWRWGVEGKKGTG